MRMIVLVFSFSLLIACDDNGGGTTADTLVADAQAGDSTATDGPATDGPGPGDAEPADSKTPDSTRLTDSNLADSTQPQDVGPAPDVGSSSLKVKIDKVSVWADLMPIVPPDPTHVNLALSFTNGGKSAIKNVALTQAAIIEVKGGKATPIQLVAQKGFNGNVPGGQTVQASFKKTSSTSPVPLPGKCGNKVQVRFTVSHAGGKVGPLTSSAVSFTCAY